MAAISKVESSDPDSQADRLRRLSPIHKIDRARAATLVLHGANDTNVPVVEAEQVVASLNGVPVEYVLFPDECHGFSTALNRVRSATADRRLVQGAPRGPPNDLHEAVTHERLLDPSESSTREANRSA